MPTVSVRLPDEDAEDLDGVADLLETDRSTAMRKALREGLQSLRERHAVERYQSGEASVTEAAAMADLSVGEWLEVAHERNLTTQLTAEDLRFDVEHAGEL